jgi:two-component sensor histidine kinase
MASFNRLRFAQGASLRTRLMALALVALAPGVIAVLYTTHQIDRLRRAEVAELALQGARHAADETNRIIAGVESLLLAVSRAPIVRDGDAAGCNTYLRDLGPHLPHLVAVSVLDLDGRWFCGSVQPADPAVDLSDRTYFREALSQDGLVLGLYTTGRVSGRPVLPVALSFPNRTGAKGGVLVATIDLTWLGQVLRERGVPRDGSLTVADREGTIVAREPQPQRFVGTRIPDAFHRLMHASGTGVEEVRSQDGTKRVLGYVPVSSSPPGLYVSAGLSSQASFQAVSRAALYAVLMIIAGAIAALCATWLVGSRAFIKPLERLDAVLSRWRNGERGARTELTAEAGEIGALGMQLDAMMDEIITTQAKRDLLSRELSHRVKNTLSTVQALAMATLNGPQPARDLLPEYLQRIAALGRMHDVLLRDHWESASLLCILDGVLRPLCPDLTRVRMTGEDCELPPHHTLGMTMVLHELTTNALKHGALSTPQGRIEIAWTLDRSGSDTLLDVSWRERGGPTTHPPNGRKGFGMRLMSRAFAGAGTAVLRFEPDGVVCHIALRLSADQQIAA